MNFTVAREYFHETAWSDVFSRVIIPARYAKALSQPKAANAATRSQANVSLTFLRQFAIDRLMVGVHSTAFSGVLSQITGSEMEAQRPMATEFHHENWVSKLPEHLKQAKWETPNGDTVTSSPAWNQETGDKAVDKWLSEAIRDVTRIDVGLNSLKAKLESDYKRLTVATKSQQPSITFHELSLLSELTADKFRAAALFYTLVSWDCAVWPSSAEAEDLGRLIGVPQVKL